MSSNKSLITREIKAEFTPDLTPPDTLLSIEASGSALTLAGNKARHQVNPAQGRNQDFTYSAKYRENGQTKTLSKEFNYEHPHSIQWGGIVDANLVHIKIATTFNPQSLRITVEMDNQRTLNEVPLILALFNVETKGNDSTGYTTEGTLLMHSHLKAKLRLSDSGNHGALAPDVKEFTNKGFINDGEFFKAGRLISTTPQSASLLDTWIPRLAQSTSYSCRWSAFVGQPEAGMIKTAKWKPVQPGWDSPSLFPAFASNGAVAVFKGPVSALPATGVASELHLYKHTSNSELKSYSRIQVVAPKAASRSSSNTVLLWYSPAEDSNGYGKGQHPYFRTIADSLDQTARAPGYKNIIFDNSDSQYTYKSPSTLGLSGSHYTGNTNVIEIVPADGKEGVWSGAGTRVFDFYNGFSLNGRGNKFYSTPAATVWSDQGNGTQHPIYKIELAGTDPLDPSQVSTLTIDVKGHYSQSESKFFLFVTLSYSGVAGNFTSSVSKTRAEQLRFGMSLHVTVRQLGENSYVAASIVHNNETSSDLQWGLITLNIPNTPVSRVTCKTIKITVSNADALSYSLPYFYAYSEAVKKPNQVITWA